MSPQPSQPSSPSSKLLPTPCSHQRSAVPTTNHNTPPDPETQKDKEKKQSNTKTQTQNPHKQFTGPSPFLFHALRKKKNKDLKAEREEERKKGKEIEEGKRLFGGMVAEVLRVGSELKIEHPDVTDSVLEQEAWKMVFY
ncbi:hypothetical protein BOTCAL_0542g00040 [Botryotinia calthae]|uniref:Uncharacterized protein n=1 Tax=Botryotinia calthae TaxID=38488 RepID=A0A4Y8CKZ8_9HELO|nr:hypothetical protein BOTCAL_0542g00040 [Botryotinia calthae]